MAPEARPQDSEDVLEALAGPSSCRYRASTPPVAGGRRARPETVPAISSAQVNRGGAKLRRMPMSARRRSGAPSSPRWRARTTRALAVDDRACGRAAGRRDTVEHVAPRPVGEPRAPDGVGNGSFAAKQNESYRMVRRFIGHKNAFRSPQKNSAEGPCLGAWEESRLAPRARLLA
jgi:hypothetical protein